MTVAAFKKKEEKSDLIPKGSVVLLNSDEEGRFMTVSKSEGGQVLCRWHNDSGDIQNEWFYPEELQIQTEKASVDFEPDFEMDGSGESGAE